MRRSLCAIALLVSSTTALGETKWKLDLPIGSQWDQIHKELVIFPFCINETPDALPKDVNQTIIDKLDEVTPNPAAEDVRRELVDVYDGRLPYEQRFGELDCHTLGDIIHHPRYLAYVTVKNSHGSRNLSVTVKTLDLRTCKNLDLEIQGRLVAPSQVLEFGLEITDLSTRYSFSLFLGGSFFDYFTSGVFYGTSIGIGGGREAVGMETNSYARYGSYFRAAFPAPWRQGRWHGTLAYGLATSDRFRCKEVKIHTTRNDDGKESKSSSCDFETIGSESYQLFETRFGASKEMGANSYLGLDLGTGWGRDYRNDKFNSVRRNPIFVTLGYYYFR